MCGIAGVLGGDAGALGPMIGALAHRGPDGLRTEVLDGAALAHARLSIIDLECGWQPLHAAGGAVVGNGELYNYVELASEFGVHPIQVAGFLAPQPLQVHAEPVSLIAGQDLTADEAAQRPGDFAFG